jgi:ABC-type Mn2+/Zn2+ transport system permease subunit
VQPNKAECREKIMRLAIIIILAILAGFVAGIMKDLFPALHDVPTQAIIILTAFVVGIIILLFQRAKGTLHDDHWAKDQLKNKEDKS